MMRPPDSIVRRFFAAYAEELGKSLGQATALSLVMALVLLLSEAAR
ncbi:MULTISPECIES: hypothetical protein [Brevundimonas]|nr:MULTISPECIES: hypothetical protein [Brevundimonas]